MDGRVTRTGPTTLAQTPSSHDDVHDVTSASIQMDCIITQKATSRLAPTTGSEAQYNCD